jgi:hypothetical protein
MIKIIVLTILVLLTIYFFFFCGVPNTESFDGSINNYSDNKSNNITYNSDIMNKHITSAINHTEHQTCKINNSCSINNGISSCGTDNLYPILDPRFNMREAGKQCLLLEDHLNNKNKRCLDCIMKHMLIIDGLLEEAISLEKDLDKRDMYRNTHKEWVFIQRDYSLNKNDNVMIDKISMRIRMFRKPLVHQHFDLISEYTIE